MWNWKKKVQSGTNYHIKTSQVKRTESCGQKTELTHTKVQLLTVEISMPVVDLVTQWVREQWVIVQTHLCAQTTVAYSPNCSILWLQHVLYSSDDKISQPCIKQQHLLQDNSTSYLRVLGSSWGLGLRSISLLHGFKLKLVHVCPNLFHSFWSCLLSCHFRCLS